MKVLNLTYYGDYYFIFFLLLEKIFFVIIVFIECLFIFLRFSKLLIKRKYSTVFRENKTCYININLLIRRNTGLTEGVRSFKRKVYSVFFVDYKYRFYMLML